MQRPPRQMPPRAPGAQQQRAPRPRGPRPVVSSEKPTVPKQDPMAGVRILLKFYTLPTCINNAMFFSRCNKLQKDLKLWLQVVIFYFKSILCILIYSKLLNQLILF